jgi:hypothetical protein
VTATGADPLEREFRAYRSRVRRYALTWHQRDTSASSLIKNNQAIRSQVARAEIARLGVSTGDVHRIGERWLPDRLEAHDSVLDRVTGGVRSEPNDGRRLAVMLLGLPGAGKSTALRPIALELIARRDKQQPFVIDADSVRAEIPEYAGGRGSGVVQLETADLTYSRLAETAHRSGANLIFDMVGDPKYVVEDAQYLLAAKWAVVCLAATVDVGVAIERVKRRAVTTGRYVPIQFVRSVGDRPLRAYEALKASGLDLVGCARFDTTPDGTGPPVVLDTDQPGLFGTVGSPTILRSRR